MAKKRAPAQKSRPPGLSVGLYIDTHCHMLPGVDDGVKNWAEAEQCLRIARREKIAKMVLTPHIRPQVYPNEPAFLAEVFQRMKELGDKVGVDLHLGCEAYFDPGIVKAWENGELIPLGENGRYLLFELPMALMPRGVTEAIFKLRLAGAEPILAHAERYAFAQRDHLKLGHLAVSEVPMQVGTRSVAGHSGKTAQRTAFKLLEEGWIQAIASDAHSQGERAPMFREAVRVIHRRYGGSAARLLSIENPRRILAGETLLPVRCKQKMGIGRLTSR